MLFLVYLGLAALIVWSVVYLVRRVISALHGDCGCSCGNCCGCDKKKTCKK